MVKLWTHDTSKSFTGEIVVKHNDWVRDVSFANNIGLSYDMIASCSEDFTVFVSKKIDNKWVESKLGDFKVPIWRVSWSLAGNLLAVASADNLVHVYEEKTPDKWEAVAELNQNAAPK